MDFTENRLVLGRQSHLNDVSLTQDRFFFENSDFFPQKVQSSGTERVKKVTFF